MPASVLVSPPLLRLLWSSWWDYHNRHATHLSDPSFPASPFILFSPQQLKRSHSKVSQTMAHTLLVNTLQRLPSSQQVTVSPTRLFQICFPVSPSHTSFALCPLLCALQPAWSPSNTEDSPALGFRLCCLFALLDGLLSQSSLLELVIPQQFLNCPPALFLPTAVIIF